jgi:hypothetical protein
LASLQTGGTTKVCISQEEINMKIKKTKIKSGASSLRFSRGKYLAAFALSLI